MERDNLNIRELWTHVMKYFVEWLKVGTFFVDVLLVDLTVSNKWNTMSWRTHVHVEWHFCSTVVNMELIND